MPGLTVREKEHWKERIGRRIERKIETLCAAEPNFMDRIKNQARDRALESLGLAKLQAELDQIEEQKQTLSQREEQLHREMLAQVQGIPVQDVTWRGACYGDHAEVTRALQRREAVHENELLAQHPLGREILRLNQEKENLLDTVWLATSGKQIKELWKQVAVLLGDEQSPLQQAALAIDPLEED